MEEICESLFVFIWIWNSLTVPYLVTAGRFLLQRTNQTLKSGHVNENRKLELSVYGMNGVTRC